MRAMHNAAIGLVGASGYSGIELSRILCGHPEVELRFASSDRWEGESLGERLGIRGAAANLRYVPLARSESLSDGCAAVLLATPVDVSVELAPRLWARGVRVVDLSGAFRLRNPETFAATYGLHHPCPELLSAAVYGLPELFRAQVKKAALVANPGCYPTAAVLGLAPLLRAGLLAEEPIVIDAASGVTGAGRKATEALSFAEVDGDFRAYRVLQHQHAPEIAQMLSDLSTPPVETTFTAHLLPVKRGILATIYARLRPGIDPGLPARLLHEAYAAEPFVRLLSSPEALGLKAVAGTNRCDLAVACDPKTRRLIVLAALDNLVKGAAGQAVQNLNLLLGYSETSGLDTLRGFYP
jgi:N-acetyl-gamma-glutamyl-phosphate reductase